MVDLAHPRTTRDFEGIDYDEETPLDAVSSVNVRSMADVSSMACGRSRKSQRRFIGAVGVIQAKPAIVSVPVSAPEAGLGDRSRPPHGQGLCARPWCHAFVLGGIANRAPARPGMVKINPPRNLRKGRPFRFRQGLNSSYHCKPMHTLSAGARRDMTCAQGLVSSKAEPICRSYYHETLICPRVLSRQLPR